MSSSSNIFTKVEREAIRRFARLRSVTGKMRVIHEAVVSKSDVLKKQHPNLIMVTAGYRQRRDFFGKYEILSEPCLLLTTDKKWTADVGAEQTHDLLPTFVFVAFCFKKVMQRYGVPTDVQDMRWLNNLKPQRDSGIVVNVPSAPTGTITCAVYVTGSSGRYWYALSALHVFSPIPPLDQIPLSGLKFHQIGYESEAGVTTAFGGTLSTKGPSLDVQLAHVPMETFDRAFGMLPRGLVKFARSRAEVDSIAHKSQFIVLVPTNKFNSGAGARLPILAQFSGYADMSYHIEYNVRSGNVTFPARVSFSELIIIAAGNRAAASIAGDSGAAVIAMRGNSMLMVGMLIAGPLGNSESDRMVVLPAWTIFESLNWRSLPNGIDTLLPGF